MHVCNVRRGSTRKIDLQAAFWSFLSESASQVFNGDALVPFLPFAPRSDYLSTLSIALKSDTDKALFYHYWLLG